MADPMIRLGADIGGTFTDVVLEVRGQSYSTKVLTTYGAPEDAIVDGMMQVCVKAGIRPDQIGQVIHGTTLATNALIERRGAKTALITTEGFRDVIEMRTESRFEQYDLNLELPAPLLPRHMRYTVPGRMDATGSELLPLTREDIEPVVEQIAQAGYESVAVGLIHSYLNDAHEKLVRDVLSERLPDVMVSLSSEVSPQMREYERFNTVVANAYIKPQMKSYLSRLEGRLAGEGVGCKIFLMHSGGGIISLKDAADFPVRLVESGPAGGAVFAANIAARYGLDKVLSFDMGGTTAKICLIQNQTPKTSRVFEVARTYRFKKGSGMPISIPVIDMVEIGAGGGSIAHVDALQQIRVGPESAGSEPGPACYGRGGERPTVTDADLVLGKLQADEFAGGSMSLDKAASQVALQNELGEPLGMDARDAAFGLAEVVDENMANAARVHAVENGEDLSEYTMIAFGGAAPLHAARLCEKLGIDRCLIPPGAGVGSAIGFLRAPFSFEATRSAYMTLADFDAVSIKALLGELQTEATTFVRSCDNDSEILSEFKVYMRYTGQGWEIPITLTQKQALAPDAATFEALFEENYSRLFGRTVQGLDIEITVWAVNATTPPQPVERTAETSGDKVAVVSGKCSFFDAAVGDNVAGYLYRRGPKFDVGQYIDFPGKIIEDETTIIIPKSRRAIYQPDGCIDLIAKKDLT
ncbi:hydantoinase/oxoprolinase family protein [Octadecabacter sp. CECT 8868]|uniref:hydantoinase/oxoprolinase family protein n=1 Tax=Octadecabacter algicola TaxID=2909342 RepID=UPI001F3E27A7|nr:hydantoinase/oxoprolinase family protein [Octadecabacter algicola]MCF2903404.1 hydantoinase/oxoprolinase family protein [Octadecabacter algicola]